MPRIKRYKGIRQLPDGRFRVRYRDLEKKYHEEILDHHAAATVEQAIEELSRRKREVAAGGRPWEPPAPVKAEWTFNDAVDAWEEFARIHWRSHNKAPGRRKDLREAFGPMRLSEITVEAVEAFKTRLADQGYAKRTINSYLAVLRCILNKAKTYGKVATIPFPGVKLCRPENRGRLKLLREEEEALILTNCPPWLAPIVRFDLHTGLRLGEIARLSRRHVELDWNGGQGRIFIDYTKNGRSRYVPLDATARAILLEALKVHRLEDERIFPYSDSYITHEFKQAVESAAQAVEEGRRKGAKHLTTADGAKVPLEKVELGGVVFHGCRHAWCSRLLMHGVPPKTVMELGGWSGLEMVMQIYGHVTDDHKAEAIKCLDAYSGSKISTKFGVESNREEADSLSA